MMRGIPMFAIGWLCLVHPSFGVAQQIDVSRGAVLPQPISNNAVTTVTIGPRQYVLSFNGLGAGKTYADTLDKTFVYDVARGIWEQAAPVPGGVGRLASAAVAVGDLAFVFGGYSVAEDGTEVSTPWVHAFDPIAGTFVERARMPVPVDDMVALVYEDRYVYLVSGWHDVGNVNLVQRYDTVNDDWTQATPLPGDGVFGHAGGIVGNKIVYCDGVAIRANANRPRDFVANRGCYLGAIDASDGRRIDWRRIDPHPGPARYRMASAGILDKNSILFVGGTDNPYNFDGIGYDGRPSLPLARAMLFDLENLSWTLLRELSPQTMDHRSLAPVHGGWATVGGMLDDLSLTDEVFIYVLE